MIEGPKIQKVLKIINVPNRALKYMKQNQTKYKEKRKFNNYIWQF